MLLFRPLLPVLLLTALLAPMQGAAAPSKEAAARAHYQKGAQLYRQGDFAGAWLEFTSAYQLLPKKELLFNMARCEVRLGRPADALRHFQEYLEAVPNDPDAAGIRKEMEALQVEVNQIRRREEEQVRAQAQLPASAPTHRRRPWPVYGTVTGAGTLLFGIVGVALIGSVGSQYNQLNQTCAPNCRPEEVRPLEQQATAGYIFLGLTAAAAVTTAALLTWELRRSPERKATLRPTGTGLALGWGF